MSKRSPDTISPARWGGLLFLGLAALAAYLILAQAGLAGGVGQGREEKAGVPGLVAPASAPAEQLTGGRSTAPETSPSARMAPLRSADASGADLQTEEAPTAADQDGTLEEQTQSQGAPSPTEQEWTQGPAPDASAALGNLVVLHIEPLAAPCCPLPGPDKAVEVAQAVPGVLAVALDGENTLQVRYDPTVTDPQAIAAAVNQASFIVEIQTENAP